MEKGGHETAFGPPVPLLKVVGKGVQFSGPCVKALAVMLSKSTEAGTRSSLFIFNLV